jgi:hypothetical protein
VFFPATAVGYAWVMDEDSLAKTLMHRLNLPEEPIKIDQDEDGKFEATELDGDVATKSESQDQKAE